MGKRVGNAHDSRCRLESRREEQSLAVGMHCLYTFPFPPQLACPFKEQLTGCLCLQEHPECAYNCVNSPHLRPAYVLDRLYHHFSREIAQGKWAERGLPAEITEHAHLQVKCP